MWANNDQAGPDLLRGRGDENGAGPTILVRSDPMREMVEEETGLPTPAVGR